MKRFLAFVTVLSLPCSAFATEWTSFGARATAMGGTGVALGQAGESSYWNPAALGAPDNPSGAQIPFGVHAGFSGDAIKGAEDLDAVQKDCKNLGAGQGSCSQTNINNALNELNRPDSGVRADLGAGLDLKFGRLGLFVNNFTYIGGKPIIDTANTGTGNVFNNTSAMALRGISVTEIGAAYGHEIPGLPGVFGGAALKAMGAKVGYDRFAIVGSDSNIRLNDFDKNYRQSSALGVDVGGLWDVSRSFENAAWHPRVGITARNVNDPHFKQPDAAIAAGSSSRYSYQGNARMGVAISPLSFWNITVDADLTKNLTALEGVKSQQLGVGTEINVFNRSWLNIPLRGGLSRNLASSSGKTQIAAGVGFDFLHLNVDLGATITPASQDARTQGKTQKVPSEVTAGGQLAFLFGGGPAAVRASEKASGAGEPVRVVP